MICPLLRIPTGKYIDQAFIIQQTAWISLPLALSSWIILLCTSIGSPSPPPPPPPWFSPIAALKHRYSYYFFFFRFTMPVFVKLVYVRENCSIYNFKSLCQSARCRGDIFSRNQQASQSFLLLFSFVIFQNLPGELFYDFLSEF